MLRKEIVRQDQAGPAPRDAALDVPAIATVQVTSEAEGHPVERVFDGRRGPGGTRWVAGEPGEQMLVLVFDAPQAIRQAALEIEEPAVSRTQEVTLSVSSDGGRSYRDLVRQEYTFGPPGTTFEREVWTVATEPVTHLRLSIRPDKGGERGRATITLLALR
jgi:hypothetical protein